MKHLTAAALSLSMAAATAAHGQESASDPATGAIRAVSPALEAYTTDHLYGDVWQRPDLSARDRSIVSVASLIAHNQAADMPAEPAELSEIIAHLAFYAGWGPTRCPPSTWRRICAPRAG